MHVHACVCVRVHVHGAMGAALTSAQDVALPPVFKVIATSLASVQTLAAAVPSSKPHSASISAWGKVFMAREGSTVAIALPAVNCV